LLSVIGFCLAVLMGLTLGLIGSGGSMLTVPILVYLFDLKPAIATGYSLLVVGSTALVGVCGYWRQGVIRVRETIVFVLPSTVMILLTRRFIVPGIPDPIVDLNHLVISRGMFIMTLLALLMLLAGWLILKPARLKPQKTQPMAHAMKLFVGSAGVGLLAGLVGAGGGFLMIPVLITWFHLSMKEAIGTSLFVIMVNSLIGFQGDLLVGIDIDWSILGPFLILAILGMLLGIKCSRQVDGPRLKRLFGLFMLFLSGVIILAEFFSFALKVYQGG
jgi:uncharacterized protein